MASLAVGNLVYLYINISIYMNLYKKVGTGLARSCYTQHVKEGFIYTSSHGDSTASIGTLLFPRRFSCDYITVDWSEIIEEA